MLAFPPLVGALGKLFVRDIGTTPELPIWGDGLVQQSLAELYSPCGWRSAGADEFAFLIPSLAARFRPASTVPPEAAAYLQRLLAHISFAAHHLPELQQDRPRHAARPLELILASGTITTLTAGEIVREAEAARCRFFGPLCPLAQTTRANQTAATPQFTRECWVFELSVLSCLDHMLATARRGGKHDHRICPTDAFVGSLHASFNAAYVYPEFVYAHELLSLGAWLGYLVRGRAALMPASSPSCSGASSVSRPARALEPAMPAKFAPCCGSTPISRSGRGDCFGRPVAPERVVGQSLCAHGGRA
jgi:hypothetical protein